MAAIISLKSIQQVVSDLPYPSKKSLKSRLVQAVMQYYTDAESVRTLQAIPAETLIQELWSTGDNIEIIRKKQKNLCSVRSSVNIDLKKLTSDGKNPDGLQLSNANIFVMSEEAKDKALDAILDKIPGNTPASLDEIAKILQMVDGMLSNLEANGTIDTTGRQHFVTEMKTVIGEITKKISSDGFQIDKSLGLGNQGLETSTGQYSTDGNPDQEVGKDTYINDSDLGAKADKSNGTHEKDGNAFGETDAGGEEPGNGGLDKPDVLDDAELPHDGENEGSARQGQLTGDPVECNSDQAEDFGRDDGDDESTQIGSGSNQTSGDGAGDGGDELKDPEFVDDIDLEDLDFRDEFDTEDLVGAGTDPDGHGLGTSSGSDPDGDGSAKTEPAAGTGHDPEAGDVNLTSSPDLEAEPVDDQELEEIDDDDIDLEELEFVDNADLAGDGGESHGNVGQSGTGSQVNDVDTINSGQGDNKGIAGGDPNKSGTDELAVHSGEHALTSENTLTKGASDFGVAQGGQANKEDSVSKDSEGESEFGNEPIGAGAGNLAGSGSNETDSGRDQDGVDRGSDTAIDSEAMPIDVDVIEEDDDDDVDIIDEDELEEPEFVDTEDDEDIDLEELEFADGEEPVESAGADDGDKTGLDGPGNLEGGAGTSLDEASKAKHDNFDHEPYSDGECDDLADPDNPSADNGLDRVESIGDEDMPDWSQNPQKARLLAEEFNRSLAAMDKFYNQYVKVPTGTYVVGCPQPKGKQNPEETFQLPEYFIGKFPVTNALFELFIEKTGYQTTAEKLGFGTVYTGRSQHVADPQTGQERKIWHADIQCQSVAGACWYQPRGPGSTIHKKRNHPVVQVSLQDAMAFAAWTGKRLPSEAEWEAAARTTDGLLFPWGDTWQSQGCNTEQAGISDTTPVDNYIDFINQYGVADCLGNVLEWTSCTANGYAKDDHSAYYIVKGGSWISGPHIGLYSQFQQTSDGHSNLLGFRCVAF